MTDATVLFPSATGPAAPSTELPAPAAPGEAAKTEAAIFYPKLYDETMRPGLTEVADMDSNTPEETEAIRATLAGEFHALALTPPEARTLLDSMVKLSKEPATPEQRNAWAEETRRAMRQQYGAAAPERLAAARALVAKTPALRDALNESGLGNRTDIVMMLAERAYRG